MIKHYLTVFLISMVPIAELRAAIPYSQAVGLPLIPSYIIAIIGNMIPVPFIYLFARKVLEIGNDMPGIIGKFCRWCTAKGEKGAVFAFLRKNGYECYESQAAAWYFSNINDSETYKEIAGNHFRFNWKTVMRVDRNV